ncbi:SAM-dependent methyltransferase [Legionella pneumophila]|uniref:SAM-dependent methyltransferase n=1 Tax=Legionella pneumophila TaxID=446 RepID=UPI000690FF7E|nr:SAM-dependent methyltransferase [Legionella pneumophila]HAT8863276.1 methylase [Legionella pneumophila subsp. pneumophila]MCZ4689276.1 SAM-dependent methyltransferase [Legionella pneumophila]MDW9185273.1 SAM-dependent methyltransferase [Legionella pneumophila]HAT2053601.1 methylase [Legionella pneumophila]HAT8892782.1 methylase [Legionella pneumophila subsp. pneumophila]
MKVLALVGTGIKTIAHITEEAKGYICTCDKVLYLVNEPLLERYIHKLAKSSESLDAIYFNAKSRENAYKNVAQFIYGEIEDVDSLCVVIYGHPCVFATPGLLAFSGLSNNIKTVVCPGISAQDCLYADLRFDPASGGIQSFDATEYLLYDRSVDISSHVVVNQIGMVGNLGLPTNTVNFEAINFIKNKLIKLYKNGKKAIIYEAALYPGTHPKITEFELEQLDRQELTTLSTLYIPPDENLRMPSSDALRLLNQMA